MNKKTGDANLLKNNSEIEKDAIELAEAIARMNPEISEKFRMFLAGFASCAEMMKNEDNKRTA